MHFLKYLGVSLNLLLTRMAAALAEMALDIAAEPVEDDVDFVNDKG